VTRSGVRFYMSKRRVESVVKSLENLWTLFSRKQNHNNPDMALSF
jgi:hypothetical protein